MASSRDSYLLLILLLTGLMGIVTGWDVSAVASEAVIRQDATFQCSLDLTDIDQNPNNFANLLEITSDPPLANGDKYVVYNFPVNIVVKDPSTINSRYSYNSSTHTMTIRSVECTDEKTFVCKLLVLITNQGGQNKESKALFAVKVPPLAPNAMTTVPVNVTGGVNEGDDVTATCNANIGRPGRGRIQWRIYRNNVEEILNENDPRIISSQTSPQPGEEPCTVRSSSAVTVTSVGVQDQNLVLTCFVINDDFPSNPSNCDSAQQSLCQQSETIRVHYSVRDIQVSRAPQTDIVVGQSVTLRCGASGFPQPKYQWSKVGDNRTLTSTMDGAFSQLVLTNVDLDDDSGNYNCTAHNVVNGITHSLSDQVHVNIVEVPPTTTPDPQVSSDPSTPDGGNPNKSSSSGDDGDDTTIIIIVVVVVVAVVIAVVVGICIYRKRQSKEDPPRPKENPFYNNRQTLGGPPDVLGDDKKKAMSGSLNNSFDMKNEDGLMYADLTYDNRPRSRKPMAIGDAASDYSDVQMPQV